MTFNFRSGFQLEATRDCTSNQLDGPEKNHSQLEYSLS